MKNRLDLPAEAAIECAKHPNIVGMKESGGDVTKIGMIMSGTNNNPKNFCVLAGATTFLLPASQVGSNGAVCGLGNMIPDECCKLQHLIGNFRQYSYLYTFHLFNIFVFLFIFNGILIWILEHGKLDEAMKLEHRLMNIQLAVMKYNTGILFVKAAMDWFPGYYRGPTRNPLLRLDEKSLSGLKREFIDNGFL